ncbi:helix-turn-helix transcriptional regulator [Capnocytophaga sp.]|uniref:helix-turn-helix transcriptional regulator n=1 Tax=Capnocytophaga sp. TaxID=44737 RepID=UPI0026DB4B2B|nr:helix-turn-helix transcriptional regulator [Capnocytophaga sp.]MDO5105171.1 helix-turn-helix transcriptional regulator [Capnocytophaga sp.]
MNSQIITPHIDLQDFVKSFWVLESAKNHTPKRNTIVPDGCMKMIFHYGDAYRHHSAERSFLLPKSFIVGQLTKPFEVKPTGETGTLLVCFYPNGLFPFADFDFKKIENSTVELSQVFGNEGETLALKVLNAITNTERIKIIEIFLRNRLTDFNTQNAIVKSTIHSILKADKQQSIAEISQGNNINQRWLERKFLSAVGLRPKQLTKIVRLQKTLKTLLNSRVTSLTALAHENDYYDQSHFIKDFKEFTGFTPKEFDKEPLKMSLIFDKNN